jgi:hypothetical protein
LEHSGSVQTCNGIGFAFTSTSCRNTMLVLILLNADQIQIVNNGKKVVFVMLTAVHTHPVDWTEVCDLRGLASDLRRCSKTPLIRTLVIRISLVLRVNLSGILQN